MFRKSILHLLVPLLIGLSIYILFRKPETLLHQFLRIHKSYFPLSNTAGNRFFLFHFPDMCWAYALCAALLIWGRLSKLMGATLAFIAVSLFEFRQAAWSFSRLDYADCGLMTLAIIIAALNIKR